MLQNLSKFCGFAIDVCPKVLSIVIQRDHFSTLSPTRMATRKPLILDEYDVYGFDIDHTLAKYKLDFLFQDSYNAMAKYLVNNKGYSKDTFHFDKDFCMRGLVLDLDKGNFLKLAEDGRVLRASHGSKPLQQVEIEKFFGANHHWEHFEKLIDSVNNLGDRYRIFENFFDMPAGVLCAHIIDCLDKQAGHHLGHYNCWPDVMEAMNHVYNPEQFRANKGDFFPNWKKNTDHYVYKCSDALKSWLRSLKKDNKKLFILTSSYEDFAKASLQFILGDDWKSYFDLYMSFARKPSFFNSKRSFTVLEGSGTQERTVAELEEGGFYLAGNSEVLHDHLRKVTGKDNPRVLFFGDSLRSDIFPSKKFANWDTVLVLEEMLSEQWSGSDEPLQKRKKNENCDHECLTSLQWGSLFTDDNIAGQVYPSKMNTLWGYIIRKYADIAIPELNYITGFSKRDKFTTFDHEDANAWGFHPSKPRSLQGSSEWSNDESSNDSNNDQINGNAFK